MIIVKKFTTIIGIVLKNSCVPFAGPPIFIGSINGKLREQLLEIEEARLPAFVQMEVRVGTCVRPELRTVERDAQSVE